MFSCLVFPPFFLLFSSETQMFSTIWCPQLLRSMSLSCLKDHYSFNFLSHSMCPSLRVGQRLYFTNYQDSFERRPLHQGTHFSLKDCICLALPELHLNSYHYPYLFLFYLLLFSLPMRMPLFICFLSFYKCMWNCHFHLEAAQCRGWEYRLWRQSLWV